MAAVAQYHNVDLRTSRDDDEAYVLPTTTSRVGTKSIISSLMAGRDQDRGISLTV